MQSKYFSESYIKSEEKEEKSEWFSETRFGTINEKRNGVFLMKKIVDYSAGIAAGIAVAVILLISAFELAMYSDFGYYEREYEKYDVLSELDMEMKDAMYVTEEMMSYLRGDREELRVVTVVEGVRQDFFNEQDRFHMEEVQRLFLGGLKIRVGAGMVLFASVLVMLFLNRRTCLRVLCRSYQAVLGVLTVLFAGLGVWVALDFNSVFVKFHEIFFDNDLWIFDPAEDYMIRMLPEGLFYDFVLRIGGIFIVGVLIFLALSIVAPKMIRNTNE